MTSEFDPYKELLGITRVGSVPNHYELLGLSLFESQVDNIDEAASAQMSKLQELSTGQYLDVSQKLLNEVSAARRCLLDSSAKVTYDEQLRTRLKRTATSRGRQQKKWTQPASIVIGVVVLLVIVLLLFRGDSAASGNLIVEWPKTDRQGGQILLDDSAVNIPDEDPVLLQVPEGRHQLVFQRTGFKDISRSIDFTPARVRLKLIWIPVK